MIPYLSFAARCLPLPVLLVLIIAPLETRGQGELGEPMVSRLEMKLTLKGEVIDVIQKGDLLTVLDEREKSYVIQTFNGKKGAVAKENLATLAESVEIYDQLIKKSPENGRLYTLRAGAKAAVGKAEEALADYDQAIEYGYDEAHAYTSRGLFYAALGQYDKAIKDYSSALEKKPDDEVPLVNRAGALMALGKPGEAIKDYTAAIKISPKNSVLYSQRAVARKLFGQMESSIEDFTRAIELADRDISAWMGRGFVYFQMQRHEEAVKDFSKVIELTPQSAVAFNNRGFNYQQLGQFKKAVKDFERSVELAPSYKLALQNLAWILTVCEEESLRDPAKAIDLAKDICEITNYEDVSDLTLLAAAFASAGQFETAIGWQEKVLEQADDRQQEVSKKILKLYHNEQAFDPELLDDAGES